MSIRQSERHGDRRVAAAARGQRQAIAWLLLGIAAVFPRSAVEAVFAQESGGGNRAPSVTGDERGGRPAAGDRGEPLPWNRSQSESGAAPAPQGPRELLALYGIDDSHLENLVDRQPLGPADEETLLKVLYRLPRIPRDKLVRWCQAEAPGANIGSRPDEHRLHVFSLAGRALGVERIELLPEAAERFEFDHYYRIRLALAGDPRPVVVCSRIVPEIWSSAGSLDAKTRAFGLFLKVGDTRGSEPQLVFAAARFEWFPDRVDPALGVGADLVALAGWGMDIALWDEVRQSDRKPLGAEDRDCFYALLAAMGQSPEGAFPERPDAAIDLAGLLNTPAAHHGRLLTVRGTARRVTRIEVAAAEIRERWHIDHYYQIDLFVALGDQIVRLGVREPGKDVPTFTGNYPVTVCTLGLPPGLVEGQDLRTEVRIPAAFFKLWAFRSQFVSAYDERQLQLGPLFVGRTPRVVPASPLGGRTAGYVAGVLFVVALLGAWYGLWRWERGNARFRRQFLGRLPSRNADREPSDSERAASRLG